ncbi:hypothetical protein Mp_5g06650 [Marchantia polymorpha subsp. ruderalis]|uniref:DUF659 domain-containing protein n=2 Tax=Marchantia polymorpha TaxID=3197 RepID=A0AAF6BFN2_MARPO|nr:hypothetical protein MARPO_0171s0018 [Marchantia polymorpha]BBN10816.1 hypothetical protein Mp_5g06650 [Marchantia polymorpha subsp. ruderalis]|eukprot:PTQ28176.1 hypothetical protein MARPO_0171s0018 [Marchantia polymorpha]
MSMNSFAFDQSATVEPDTVNIILDSQPSSVQSTQTPHPTSVQKTQIPRGWIKSDECTHCGEELDGKPDKLEFHILHRCSLDSVSRVEYMRIVERFSKRKRMAVNTSIRSQLGFESEQMASSGHYQQHLPKYFSPTMNLDILEAPHLRRVVSYRLLQKRYSECLLELGEELKSAIDVTITMDGWEDVSNNSIYAVMAITSVKQWMVDIVHFTGRPTANALQQQLILSTNKSILPLTSVVAFVLDSSTRFQHCVKKSKLPNEPPINKDIFKLVEDDYHFAMNKELCKLIKPIADSIARMEQSSTTLDQIFAELIKLYTVVKDTDVTEFCSLFKAHMIKIIQKRASEFDHPIYFVALFLNPQYQSVAISRTKTYNNIQNDIANFAKGWRFTKANTISLLADLNEYTNRSEVFTNSQPKDCAINFWQSLVGANALRVFALKIFSIAPHNAAVEHCFHNSHYQRQKFAIACQSNA